ncbi:hypothetical protein BD410DRAFT_347906 [Rickenella mellea]|uniref:Uncharacterized protein n=1 Tax=Rickenella mellea TaxID=50990 RepID=A0A4Y7QKG3_9AGAM|nr:hypothetical protein BD410DRAFT_347906 [Rickenella mellea]
MLRPFSSQHVGLYHGYRLFSTRPPSSFPSAGSSSRSNKGEEPDGQNESDLGGGESKAIVYRRKTRRDPSDKPVAEPWLHGEGLKYRDPRRGPNWLGTDVPFPLNPSFSPRPPLSDKTKNAIYHSFMRGSTLRWLSSAYGISLKRVDAILRLKGLEEHWKEVGTNFYLPPMQVVASHNDDRQRLVLKTQNTWLYTNFYSLNIS